MVVLAFSGITWMCVLKFGVEPVSWYQKVAGSVPLVCMLKCPWARYQMPNCSWYAGRHLAWQPPPSVYECMTYCKSLWTKASDKCPKCNVNLCSKSWKLGAAFSWDCTATTWTHHLHLHSNSCISQVQPQRLPLHQIVSVLLTLCYLSIK